MGFKTATTDPSGRYQIDIASGTYEYVAKVPGYGDTVGTLTVNSGQTTDGSFTMIKVHVHRPPAVTLNKTPEEFHISTGLCQKI